MLTQNFKIKNFKRNKKVEDKKIRTHKSLDQNILTSINFEEKSRGAKFLYKKKLGRQKSPSKRFSD